MLRIRRLILIPIDAALITASGFASLWLRFEGDIQSDTNGVTFLGNLIWSIPAIVALSIVLFALFGLYRSLWEFASVTELMRIFVASVSSCIGALLITMLSRHPLPRSMYIIWFMIMLLSVGALRISFRLYRRFKYGIAWEINPFAVFSRVKHPYQTRVMLVGAGTAGSTAIREYSGGDKSVHILCAVDDDPRKRNMLINGVRVMGDRNDIPRLVAEYGISEIIVAIPTAKRRELAEILSICNTTGARLKLLPSTDELINGSVTVKRIRDVNIEDLLGRDEVQLDTSSVSAYICGKTVLVTGGGGSIGSELCRHISRFKPSKLVVFDIYENNMYLLARELGTADETEFIPLVGSIRDSKRLKQVFCEYRPDVVFHAAAHKHVPLMEASPEESVKNNIFGTYQTALAAIEAGVSKFVLISTDKAVNPTNIMGATKRMAELVIQGLNTRQSVTDFVAVRFGNVLGSDGSVIPIFRRQIASGGPVTLTHPEVTRYFMLIPEAASLVLQAGALASGGEIFILDMGEPVRIIDLVHDLIRLSGLEPEVDIPIAVTGLRPGEKLYEELLTDEEGLRSTPHEKIFICKPTKVDMTIVERQLNALRQAIEDGDTNKLVALLHEFVPTYTQVE